ncbi:glycosyl transferase family 1 [Verrucomicrobiota bacterium]|nr:glycosyl transferase family 1 [Verrucomicrobiota bacterium]
MNIVQITPGAGGMYCGNCFRDNALVAELRRQGHAPLLVPLYLPMTLDEENQGAGTPIFFNGINVYLEQVFPAYRKAPQWLHNLLASPVLLKLAAGRAAKTRAAEVGELTLSMLRGEEGNQERELEQLIAWLRTQPKPDVVCLSNAMLVGMARRLKRELGTRVVCTLQGEDAFLDAMPEPVRGEVWRTLAERGKDVDLFIAPSRYFGELMAKRLGLAAERLRVVPNGISLEGYHAAGAAVEPPALGFFARMCPEKGLDTVVEAFIEIRRRGRVPRLQLRIGGACGPGDVVFVNGLKQRLAAAGLAGDVEFHPNLSRAEKLAFLRSLTVFSVPALYGEAFGLYVIEALASGVPVVQPRVASFPELIAATGGGVLCEPRNVGALAEAIEALVLDQARARALGEAGRRAVEKGFSVRAMAEGMAGAFAGAIRNHG